MADEEDGPRSCLQACLQGPKDPADQPYHVHTESKEQPLETERRVRWALPKLPCPLGSALAATVALPVALVAFAWIDLLYINQIVGSLFRLNHRKYCEYAEQKYKRGDTASCLCNWYLTAYLCFNLLFVLVWAVLLLVYPLVGTAHAVLTAAHKTYEESDMWQESFETGVLDYMGWGNSDKERCAERCGSMCVLSDDCGVGRACLFLSDFFLLSGVAEGLKCLPSIFRVHRRILQLLDGLLDTVNDLEEAEVFGINVDVVPMEKLLKRTIKDVPKVAADAIAANDAETKSKPKTQGAAPSSSQGVAFPTGLVVSLFSLVLAIAFWAVVLARTL